MGGGLGLLTRGTDLGEQQLQVVFSVDSGDVDDGLVAAGDDRILAGLDAGKQV